MPYVYGSVYNASKAALHAYSATLRVELAPLGVRVLTIVTGGVQSQIARTHRSLPEDSFYAVVKEEYERRQTHSQQVGMPNEVYARSVVRQVLTGGKSDVWEGALSWVAWFVVSFLPRGVMVSFKHSSNISSFVCLSVRFIRCSMIVLGGGCGGFPS